MARPPRTAPPAPVEPTPQNVPQPDLTTPTLNNALTTLSSLPPILLAFVHRNKNQFRRSRWWGELGMLRRNLSRLIASISTANEGRDRRDTEQNVTKARGVRRKMKVIREREARMRGKKAGVKRGMKAVGGDDDDETREGGDIEGQERKQRMREEEAKETAEVEEIATWMRDVLVPKVYIAFGQLAADQQFAPMGLMLIGVLARVHTVLGGLVGERGEDLENQGWADAEVDVAAVGGLDLGKEGTLGRRVAMPVPERNMSSRPKERGCYDMDTIPAVSREGDLNMDMDMGVAVARNEEEATTPTPTSTATTAKPARENTVPRDEDTDDEDNSSDGWNWVEGSDNGLSDRESQVQAKAPHPKAPKTTTAITSKPTKQTPAPKPKPKQEINNILAPLRAKKTAHLQLFPSQETKKQKQKQKPPQPKEQEQASTSSKPTLKKSATPKQKLLTPSQNPFLPSIAGGERTSKLTTTFEPIITKPTATTASTTKKKSRPPPNPEPPSKRQKTLQTGPNPERNQESGEGSKKLKSKAKKKDMRTTVKPKTKTKVSSSSGGGKGDEDDDIDFFKIL